MDDRGTHSAEPVDYPPICLDVARTVAGGRADRGIVLGGGGGAETDRRELSVAGVRAALCNDLHTARLSRQHNDANVLSMGGRIVAFELADEDSRAVARDGVRRRTAPAADRSDQRERNGSHAVGRVRRHGRGFSRAVTIRRARPWHR